MKWNTAENIRFWRKAKGLSQEQLAEALGITYAAVSKWERGASTPDLSYLVEMADLLGVSVDTLVGYRMQSSALNDMVERIRALQRQKRFEEGAAEAEKALVRYPNDFRVVYRSGILYEMMGIEEPDASKSRKALCRAAELLERSLLLISQNEDPEISEMEIRSEAATCYLTMGQMAKGIDLLKSCNVGGMNNARIGMQMAIRESYPPEEAANYLMQAFSDCLQNLLLTMTGYANYYGRLNNLTASLEALEWLIGFLESLKTNADTVSYIDRVCAPCYAECANLHQRLGQPERVKPCLQKAYELAVRFDANPTYNVYGIKFCIGDTKNATAYDDFGQTVLEAVEGQLSRPEWDDEVRKVWKAIKQEA